MKGGTGGPTGGKGGPGGGKGGPTPNPNLALSLLPLAMPLMAGGKGGMGGRNMAPLLNQQNNQAPPLKQETTNAGGTVSPSPEPQSKPLPGVIGGIPPEIGTIIPRIHPITMGYPLGYPFGSIGPQFGVTYPF